MHMSNNGINIEAAQASDQKQWDAYVLNHPDATPYHLYAWRQAIGDAYGHQSEYLVARKDEQIMGLLPLVHLRLAPFINQLVSLPFCDAGNCLADDEQAQVSLLEQALRYRQEKGAATLHMRGSLLPAKNNPIQLSTIDTGKVRMLLELPTASDVLFGSFKSKIRSQIRKAEKNGVVFRWGDSSDIAAAYSVFAKNMHELGSPVHAKAILEAVLLRYGQSARMGLVEYEDRVIGMGVILFTKKSVSIPWASTLRAYNRLAPNMILYWNLLKYSADHGYQCFDFGRSTTGEGTFKFKQQWGAKPEPLVWYEAIRNQPGRMNRSTSSWPKDRRRLANLWRKLPENVAVLLGPPLRKYVSL